MVSSFLVTGGNPFPLSPFSAETLSQISAGLGCAVTFAVNSHINYPCGQENQFPWSNPSHQVLKIFVVIFLIDFLSSWRVVWWRHPLYGWLLYSLWFSAHYPVESLCVNSLLLQEISLMTNELHNMLLEVTLLLCSSVER